MSRPLFYGSKQTVCGTATDARLPLEPSATTVPLMHLARLKRTKKRPRAFAVAALRRGPTETATRSAALKPRPATVKGFMLIILSAGRAPWAAGSVELSDAAPSPNVIRRTTSATSNTTPEV